MAVEGFEAISIADLPDDLRASEEVSRAGIKIRTLPAGKYFVTVESVELRRAPADSSYAPNRLGANFKLATEEGRFLYMDVSWEPGPNSDRGLDSSNELYSQVEMALDMYGEPIKEVLDAASTASFLVEINEVAKIAVGDLPEEKQEYYTNVKGFGEMTEVNFYIKAEEEEVRNHVYAMGAKVRNYVRNVSAA